MVASWNTYTCPVASHPVVIVDYDPIWPVQFRELASCLENVLRPLAKAIEHVGSTAVPGLAAKPILDIDVVIPSRSELGEAIRSLGQVGYHHEGDLDVPGREAFGRSGSDVPRDGSDRAWPNHNLYVCAEDGRELARHLAFRDYLRQSPAMTSRYAELKKALAEQFRDDRDAYSEGKTSLVEEVLRGIEA